MNKETFEKIRRGREAKWRAKWEARRRQRREIKPLEELEEKKIITEEIIEKPEEEAKEEEKEEKVVKPVMKFCPGCGEEIREKWTYHKCGWKEEEEKPKEEIKKEATEEELEAIAEKYKKRFEEKEKEIAEEAEEKPAEEESPEKKEEPEAEEEPKQEEVEEKPEEEKEAKLAEEEKAEEEVVEEKEEPKEEAEPVEEKEEIKKEEKTAEEKILEEKKIEEGIEEEKPTRIGRYVYCLIPKTKEEISLGNIGIENSRVYTMKFGKINAVVSDVPFKDYKKTEDNLRLHDDAIRKAMERFTVVPMSFGMVFKNEKILRAVLKKSRNEIKKALKAVDGKVELGVKVLTNGDSFDEDAFTQDVKALRKLSASANLGRKFSKKLILNVSYLVAKDLVDKFSEEVKRLKEKYSQLKIQYTGPWAPYNFVTINIGGG